MQTFKIDDMKRGWFVGDFEPSAFKILSLKLLITSTPKVKENPLS